jgi:hypothetical protein
MKGGWFSEKRIIGIPREQEAGAKTKEVCQRDAISDATLYILDGPPVTRRGW